MTKGKSSRMCFNIQKPNLLIQVWLLFKISFDADNYMRSNI